MTHSSIISREYEVIEREDNVQQIGGLANNTYLQELLPRVFGHFEPDATYPDEIKVIRLERERLEAIEERARAQKSARRCAASVH